MLLCQLKPSNKKKILAQTTKAHTDLTSPKICIGSARRTLTP